MGNQTAHHAVYVHSSNDATPRGGFDMIFNVTFFLKALLHIGVGLLGRSQNFTYVRKLAAERCAGVCGHPLFQEGRRILMQFPLC